MPKISAIYIYIRYVILFADRIGTNVRLICVYVYVIDHAACATVNAQLQCTARGNNVASDQTNSAVTVTGS